MIYQYQALNRKGERVSDIIDATSEAQARQKLKSSGLYVSKLVAKSAVEAEIKKESNSGSFSGLFQKIKLFIAQKLSTKQVGIFSRQLATLLNAGLPLLRAITDILEQTEHQHFKQVIADIKEGLESGVSFSNCLQKHRGVFSDMYINMVRVGENLGSLDSVVERLADIEENSSILRSKIQSALLYPAFMILFSIGIIIFLMVKIVPSLSEMFVDMGRELPLPTQIVMAASNFLQNNLLWIFLAAIAAIYALNRYNATPAGRRKIDELKMKVPLVKGLYNKLLVLRFTQNLGIMLTNNVDILRSFEIVKKIVGNVIIEEKVGESAHKIREGAPVSKALQSAEFLPKMVIGMIAAGEASDTLDEMLVKIGSVYETEFDLTITSLTNMIEPLIIVLMGFTIGLIVISVMLPIMEMNMLVQ